MIDKTYDPYGRAILVKSTPTINDPFNNVLYFAKNTLSSGIYAFELNVTDLFSKKYSMAYLVVTVLRDIPITTPRQYITLSNVQTMTLSANALLGFEESDTTTNDWTLFWNCNRVINDLSCNYMFTNGTSGNHHLWDDNLETGNYEISLDIYEIGTSNLYASNWWLLNYVNSTDFIGIYFTLNNKIINKENRIKINAHILDYGGSNTSYADLSEYVNHSNVVFVGINYVFNWEILSENLDFNRFEISVVNNIIVLDNQLNQLIYAGVDYLFAVTVNRYEVYNIELSH